MGDVSGFQIKSVKSVETSSACRMNKNNDLISEVLRDTKHPFRSVTDRPRKPQKHRYERRKARECLRIGEWSSEFA
jgi:hypothetical protein